MQSWRSESRKKRRNANMRTGKNRGKNETKKRGREETRSSRSQGRWSRRNERTRERAENWINEQKEKNSTAEYKIIEQKADEVKNWRKQETKHRQEMRNEGTRKPTATLLQRILAYAWFATHTEQDRFLLFTWLGYLFLILPCAQIHVPSTICGWNTLTFSWSRSMMLIFPAIFHLKQCFHPAIIETNDGFTYHEHMTRSPVPTFWLSTLRHEVSFTYFAVLNVVTGRRVSEIHWRIMSDCFLNLFKSFFREMGKLRNCSSDQSPHTVKICGKAFFASLPSRTHRKIMLQLSKTFWTTRTCNLNLHILLIQRVTEPFDPRSPTWRRSKPCLPRSAQMIPESSLSKCSKNSSARQLSKSILKVWVWMSPTRGHFSNS